jgi:hypothetical protein
MPSQSGRVRHSGGGQVDQTTWQVGEATLNGGIPLKVDDLHAGSLAIANCSSINITNSFHEILLMQPWTVHLGAEFCTCSVAGDPLSALCNHKHNIGQINCLLLVLLVQAIILRMHMKFLL